MHAIAWQINIILLSPEPDANVALLNPDITVDETNPGPATAEVCVVSGITGDIELELVVTLDITDGKAGKYPTLHIWPLKKSLTPFHCHACAVAGDDYTDLNDPVTVTFSASLPPGPPTDSECITIDILDDDALEGDHEFTVMITDTSHNATVDSASSTTTITISDNEGLHLKLTRVEV